MSLLPPQWFSKKNQPLWEDGTVNCMLSLSRCVSYPYVKLIQKQENDECLFAVLRERAAPMSCHGLQHNGLDTSLYVKQSISPILRRTSSDMR